MEQELEKLNDLSRYFSDRRDVMGLGIASVLHVIVAIRIMDDTDSLMVLADTAHEIAKYQRMAIAEKLRALPIKSSQP